MVVVNLYPQIGNDLDKNFVTYFAWILPMSFSANGGDPKIKSKTTLPTIDWYHKII
jgi:hypothetical protein